MKELDIHSVTVNKWKAASASKTKVEQRPNLLKQDFSTTGLNQKWTADMTYIQTKRNGWCYLSTINHGPALTTDYRLFVLKKDGY